MYIHTYKHVRQRARDSPEKGVSGMGKDRKSGELKILRTVV